MTSQVKFAEVGDILYIKLASVHEKVKVEAVADWILQRRKKIENPVIIYDVREVEKMVGLLEALFAKGSMASVRGAKGLIQIGENNQSKGFIDSALNKLGSLMFRVVSNEQEAYDYLCTMSVRVPDWEEFSAAIDNATEN